MLGMPVTVECPVAVPNLPQSVVPLKPFAEVPKLPAGDPLEHGKKG